MNAHTPQPAGSLLASRAMLTGLTIRQWSARKLDRKVTDEVNASHGAHVDAGRYNKALIAKEALGAIIAAATAARTLHYSRTLPWLDDGARILPAAAYASYSDSMRRLRVDFESAVDAFAAQYDSFVDDARVRLNGMFRDDDYPTAAEIRSKFGFAVRVLPMPDASDFRAQISDNQAATIRSEIEESTRVALQVAMGDAWQRVTECVSRMVERLNAYKPQAAKGLRAEGIFRDSLVENVRDLVEILPGFNLTGDAFLAQTIARMETDLCSHSADDLRDDAALRRDTAKAAEEILASVSQYLA